MTDGYGPQVHLWGIDPSQLPPDRALPEQLKPFLTSILAEANYFIKDLPAEASQVSFTAHKCKSWTPRKKVYRFASSAAPVHLFERQVCAQKLRCIAKRHPDKLPQISDPARLSGETWFLRRSTHRDAAQPKTASWSEFHAHFKKHHADSEMAFTDSVVKTTLRRSWDCTGIEVQLGDGDGDGDGGDAWGECTLRLEESVHKLPFPLKKRVFPVLQATAMAKGKKEFLVVQIAFTGGPAEENAADTVTGAYTAIERFREVQDPNGRGERVIEWVMGTASDAKGVLPGFVQVLAVPDALPKDVDWFMEWIDKQRRGV